MRSFSKRSVLSVIPSFSVILKLKLCVSGLPWQYKAFMHQSILDLQGVFQTQFWAVFAVFLPFLPHKNAFFAFFSKAQFYC
jgi:hypothetical protein